MYGELGSQLGSSRQRLAQDVESLYDRQKHSVLSRALDAMVVSLSYDRLNWIAGGINVIVLRLLHTLET